MEILTTIKHTSRCKHKFQLIQCTTDTLHYSCIGKSTRISGSEKSSLLNVVSEGLLTQPLREKNHCGMKADIYKVCNVGVIFLNKAIHLHLKK